HKSVGGSDQMYMTPFVCNVTNVRGDAKPIDYSNAQPPRRCDNGQPCVKGPKVPMYWMQKEGNNMPEIGNTQSAPIYNSNYGFQEGAQNDIFVGGNSNNNGTNNGGSNNGGNTQLGSVDQNTDRSGQDMPNMPIQASNVGDCQSKCYNNQDCQSWAFDSCGTNCWLKNGQPTAGGGGCRTSGTINGRGGNNNNSGSFGPIQTGDRPGNDLDLVKAANVQDCQQKCLARQGCGSYAWDTCGNSWCWLKTGQPGLDTSVGCRQSGVVNK
ncbi:hypothetical protein PROFUN_16847, partial [Planoprotostelium fungivorum]